MEQLVSAAQSHGVVGGLQIEPLPPCSYKDPEHSTLLRPPPHTSFFSLGLAVLGLSPGAGRGAEMSPVAPPALTQHKVIVGGGAHGVKNVGFIWDLEL